jgi:hypothetical protein
MKHLLLGISHWDEQYKRQVRKVNMARTPSSAANRRLMKWIILEAGYWLQFLYYSKCSENKLSLYCSPLYQILEMNMKFYNRAAPCAYCLKITSAQKVSHFEEYLLPPSSFFKKLSNHSFKNNVLEKWNLNTIWQGSLHVTCLAVSDVPYIQMQLLNLIIKENMFGFLGSEAIQYTC